MDHNSEKQFKEDCIAEIMDKVENYLSGYGNNPRMLVIQGHLLIEHYIDEIFFWKLQRGELLKTFGFGDKMLILKALNCVDENAIYAAERLNKIRNKCVHGLDYKVTNDDIGNLGKFFPERYAAEKKKRDKDSILLVLLITILAQFSFVVHYGNSQKKSE